MPIILALTLTLTLALALALYPYPYRYPPAPPNQEGHIPRDCKEKRPKQKHNNPAAAAPPTKKAAKPCYKFQRGECSRGDACIFVHVSA